MEEATARDTLLRASTLLHLFRTITLAETADQKQKLELHIIRLINEVSGTDGGFVLLTCPGQSLHDAARQRDFPALSEAVDHACAEGIVHVNGLTVAPLYVYDEIAGVTGVLGPDCSEVLSAIITLASTALENAREFDELRAENALLRTQAEADGTGIIGESAGIRRLRSLIARIAPQETTALILGESGTGKELVARAIHAGSLRAKRPFMAINCAALTETLLESELFGHEKGAFTGAVTLKKGKLEMAEGGTVFLDEVGELAAGLQAKLLRVLQERTFERVGATGTLPLDIRLIAATNRDLAAEAKHGGFRLDLYHRLNVVQLRTSPLREHPEDIPILASRFLELLSARCHRRVSGISPDAQRCLMRYSWPGNVRELQNAIEHAVILGSSESLLPEDLPESVLEATAPADLPSSYHSALGETRRDCVINAWRDAAGNHREAARILGMHPNSLRRLIRHLALRDTLSRSVSGAG